MATSTETLSGYIIDAECVRKSPVDEVLDRARAHSRDCGLMGHCVESGFILVNENGRVVFLDDQATLPVLDAMRGSEKNSGIRLRAFRKREGESMHTSRVEEIRE